MQQGTSKDSGNLSGTNRTLSKFRQAKGCITGYNIFFHFLFPLLSSFQTFLASHFRTRLSRLGIGNQVG